MASRERLHSIPLTALVLFFLILGSSGASAGTETQLTHNALLTDSTAIYGNIVTWSETAGNGVHVYDIAAGKEINVGSTGGGNVRVCGNNIIWADMDGNISMYDVSTDNWTTISSDGDLPDIYGNYVVYTKYYYIQDNKNDDIYLYDLNTHNETKIASVHGYPAIYDKKVVWSQANSNNGYDIYKYDISTNQTSIITTADSYVSKLDIYGNVVVWTESYKVYMYDMASHKTTQVTNTGYAYDPAIDGDRIVYTLSESHSSDIYMYEISTARTTRITTSTMAFSPSIYEDKIIYADLRNPENPDVRDIFLYNLSSTVQNPLVAEFTANVTSGTAPLVVLFTDTSTGGVPTSWHWDTGDGIYSKHAMNATHTFTKPGSYTVSLTVGNAVGNSTATKPNYIVVTDPNAPVANFNSSVTEGYAPLTVQFNDISQNAMSRVWDFDSDGKADSTDVSPVYTYTTPGTYTVNLTVRNAYGTTSKTGTITVLTENGPNIGTETRITTSELASHPDIYDNRIVWQDFRNGNYDIYMYDLSTSKETRITANESNQIYPAIYGDRIVWQDDRNGQYDIYMYDISTSTEIRISTYESDQDHPGTYGNRHPDIYGERIVWDDYRNGLPDIYMYDLSTSKETQITTHESNQEFPAIYGDRVVWQDYRKGVSDMYMYDLSISKETQINSNGKATFFPEIYGNRIMLINYHNGSGDRDIYMYDLSTSRETQITNSGSADSPAIYSDKIVWEDKRTGNWDIYIYNLATSKETQITNDESNQESPAIYDNRIVWQDRRKGGSDIYICTISKEKTKPIIPAVDFSANVTSGYTPLSVQFTDLSQHSTSRSWDFGDGATSTEQNPLHTYSAAGTYAVNLTAGNANGTSLKTAQITVLETSSESSGGSSHSSSGNSDGGGAGGSPEPAKNVQVKELSQAFVTNEKTVKFDFPKNATCVVYVSFDSKKTFGKTTTIAEQLKGKSTLVSKLPYGEVYKSFNIWVGNGGVATSKNIENPVVCFKVEKSWINDKKINEDSITLNRYSDKKWEQLPVTLSGEDNKFMYFTAETSGFSSFVITGTSKTSSEEIVSVIEVDYPETINNNTENKEPQKEQKEILKTPGFEIYYGVASLLVVLLYKKGKKGKIQNSM